MIKDNKIVITNGFEEYAWSRRRKKNIIKCCNM